MAGTTQTPGYDTFANQNSGPGGASQPSALPPPTFSDSATPTSPAPIGVPRWMLAPPNTPPGTPGLTKDSSGQWVLPYAVPVTTQSAFGYSADQLRGMGYAPTADQLSTSTQMVAPTYHAGDEWLPAQYNTKQITQLQAELAQAGFFGLPDANGGYGYVPGVWDKQSRDAYSNLLGAANATGTDSTSVLKARLNEPAAQRPPNQSAVYVTNPDEIKGVLYNVAPNVIGRELTPAETDAFVNQFQATQYQGRVLKKDKNGTLMVNSPYAGANQATYEAQLREQHPVEAGATAIGSMAAEFMKMFGSGPQAGLEATGGRPG